MKSVIRTFAAGMVLVCVLSGSMVVAAQDVCSVPDPNAERAVTPQVVGEWEFKGQMAMRMSMPLLIITRNAEGKYEGKWKGRWADSNVSDITYENGKMRFVQTGGRQNQQFKTEYEATIDGKKITGKGKNESGEVQLEGALMTEPNVPLKTGSEAICGKWDLRITMPAREFVEKLVITKNEDGTLAGNWVGQRGENSISDLKLEGGKLTFTRTSKFGEREFTTTFEGSVEGNQLKGVFKSEAGERETAANRVTAAKPVEGKKADANEPAAGKKAEPNKPASPAKRGELEPNKTEPNKPASEKKPAAGKSK